MRSLSLFFLFFLVQLGAHPQTTKPRSVAVKPKPAAAKPSATPQKKQTTKVSKKPDETAEWDKVSKLTDPSAKISAIKKFNEIFPASARRSEALALLVTTRFALANTKLAAADVDGAAVLFKDAAADAPKPLSDTLWTDVLSKVPLNLYFRGARAEAYEVARSLEDKTDGSSAQSLSLANSYLTVEDGASARRLVERVIAVEPGSSIAYQTLGLAERLDFQLEESAGAFAKAVELDPQSLPAKRGLAEAKRSLGRSEEAVALYREILAKEEGNIPAQTGLILALFDAGKRADAETELAKALSANEGNVILLAGAAYWYAGHGQGDKAVDLAQKAIAADPRYIWSHIALARGLELQNRFAEAEKTLFNAQRYGNFPTMEYELASARVSAGYYRDAADELSKNFSSKDGVITAKLGGRIAREGRDISEVIGYERRASIFAPTAADNSESAAKLVSLLEFRQALDAAEPNVDLVSSAADKFVAGDDKMRVFRQIFVAKQLLGKNLALNKVIDLAKGAAPLVDSGLASPSAPSAVMAGEIYDVRLDSARRGEYVNVPDIPRNVMSAVMRGDIEAITGWAQFQLNNADESVTHLKRAVAVFPADSAWWRTNMWRLGTALAASGKDAEALDAYIKAYKSTGAPDGIRYAMIESIYKRLNGSTEGLEFKIGPNPTPPVADVKPSTEPVVSTPEASATPAPAPASTEPVPNPTATPAPVQSGDEKVPRPLPAVYKECNLTASEDNVVLGTSGSPLSLMVSSDGDISLDDLTGMSSSPADITVTREIIVSGVSSRAVFAIRSASGKSGLYTVTFQMPCGKKDVSVTVK